MPSAGIACRGAEPSSEWRAYMGRTRWGSWIRRSLEWVTGGWAAGSVFMRVGILRDSDHSRGGSASSWQRNENQGNEIRGMKVAVTSRESLTAEAHFYLKAQSPTTPASTQCLL